jgi:hypothetical protein
MDGKENTFYEFDCGCKFPIVDSKIKDIDGLPSLYIDYQNINHQCYYAWDLYSSGRTKGIFQLEKSLGQGWAKKVSPCSIEELAALIAVIRPGTLKSIVDGKSMAQHYVDRKNGEEYDLFHPEAKESLGSTYGVMLYQEQTLAIARKFAGFSLIEADIIRKGIGKKDAELLASIKQKFLDGCEKTGIITYGDAVALFDIIEKSNRYSFNKCLSPSTIVENNRGEFKTIEEVEIGDMILAPSKNGDIYVEVIDKIDNGEKELFEITLESGRTIECTIDHKFLCSDGIVRPLYEIIEENHSIMCEDSV